MAALATVIAWGAFGSDVWSGWWLAIPAAGFLGLAVVHDRVLMALDRARRAVEVYQRGLARIEDRWSGIGPTGEAYAPAEHPYAADLDLFGNGSLFQLLSAARLHAGEQTLANWLLAPGDPASVGARQAAIDDLRDRVDVREQLALTGDSVSAWLDTASLASWGAQPPLLTGIWPRAVGVGLALANLAALVAGFVFEASSVWLVLSIGGSVAFSMIWRTRVHKVIASVNAPARHLRLLAEVPRARRVRAGLGAASGLALRQAGGHGRHGVASDRAAHAARGFAGVATEPDLRARRAAAALGHPARLGD